MTRALATVFLGLLGAVPAAAGEPVLLPDFTPATTSEFGLAGLLQDNVEQALARAGHVVLTAEVVEPVVGGDLDACADTPTCPQEALGELPARFGVVVLVRRDGDDVEAMVDIYEQSGAEPVESLKVPIEPGNEDAFGIRVVDRIDELASVMGPADAGSLIAAARLITAHEEREADAEGGRDGEGQPDAPDEPEPDEPDEPDEPEPDPPASGAELDQARLQRAFDETDYAPRHLVGVRDAFLAQDDDIRPWMATQAPHGGRVIVEVRGGIGIGDVDRVAYVRTELAGANAVEWFREGPAQGQRVRAGLFVGYAPSAWVDVGVLLGLQYGERILDSAWTDGNMVGSASTDSVQAVQFDVEPRIRFLPVRMGPVKPYLYGGVQVRLFDRWRITPVENVAYAEPPGGAVAGPSGGAGLLVDPSPIFGFFLEGGGAYHSGVRAEAVSPTGIATPSNAPSISVVATPARYTLTVVGGVQFRI